VKVDRPYSPISYLSNISINSIIIIHWTDNYLKLKIHPMVEQKGMK